jgi:hypothetical protein
MRKKVTNFGKHIEVFVRKLSFDMMPYFSAGLSSSAYGGRNSKVIL